MNHQAPLPRRWGSTWQVYLILVGLLVGVVLAFDIIDQGTGISAVTKTEDGGRAEMAAGDKDIRLYLLPTSEGGSVSKVTDAIDSYREAGSSPDALRRIIVARSSFLKKPADDEMYRLAGRGAKYASEVEMWRAIYGPEQISKDTAGAYISRIARLDLGPLGKVAVSDVYERSGQTARATAAMQSARDSALLSLAALIGLTVVYIMAGVAGLVLGIMFILRCAASLRDAPAPRLQPSVLLISFLVYFVSYLCLETFFAIGVELLGFGRQNSLDMSVQLVFQLMSMAGAFALGMVALRNMTALTREDPSEIGLRFRPLGPKVLWGIGAFCVGVPLLIASEYGTQWLLNTFFHNIQTPEHPIISDVVQGGIPFVLSMIIAVVGAPIVEEVAFRGYLYTALRSSLGVWGAALLSAAIFAAVHPTVSGQFLPLLCLGVVLSIVREKTGSLLPAMVCHAINNLLVLLLSYFGA